MQTLTRTAQKYEWLACCMKSHLLASTARVSTSTGHSAVPVSATLLEPGETPHDNAQFLVFCAAVIRAVHKYSELLRVAVATSGNDHRLGANEAPPAIISIFLGDQLADVFEQLKTGKATSSKQSGVLKVGVDVLPPLPKHAGDRNRTSPFAFTGNKFEFRAVGSSQSIAGPLVVLNTIMAESLDYIATNLEKTVGNDKSKLNDAIQALLKQIANDHSAVVFNGNGYSEEWHQEAEKRGLPNLRNTVTALPALLKKEYIELFEKYRFFRNAKSAAVTTSTANGISRTSTPKRNVH